MHNGRTRTRVVVTGLGVVSPIGHSRDTFWDSLLAGRNGITSRAADRTTEILSFAGHAPEFRGKIDDFGALEPDVAKAIRKALKLMNRETQMAVAAGQQALAESAILNAGVDRERVGVCFGSENVSMMPDDFLRGVRACTNETGEFEFGEWGPKGLAEVEPLWLLKCLPNMPSCYLAMFNGLQGPNNSITAGSVSANLAIAESVRLIEDGDADAVLTGATGTKLHPFNYMHTPDDERFAASGVDPATVCRPFDRDRSGSVPGEGAAAFTLESLDRALERGARIYGEIIATSSRSAGQSARREAVADAIRACFDSGDLDADLIGHLHAHGLSSDRIDADEAQGIRDVFGRRTDDLPVMALKSYIGNAGAGAGALELAASLLSLAHRELIPVRNFETPDPGCPIRPVTGRSALARPAFLNLSLSVDGQATCVAADAYEWN